MKISTRIRRYQCIGATGIVVQHARPLVIRRVFQTGLNGSAVLDTTLALTVDGDRTNRHVVKIPPPRLRDISPRFVSTDKKTRGGEEFETKSRD